MVARRKQKRLTATVEGCRITQPAIRP